MVSLAPRLMPPSANAAGDVAAGGAKRNRLHASPRVRWDAIYVFDAGAKTSIVAPQAKNNVCMTSRAKYFSKPHGSTLRGRPTISISSFHTESPREAWHDQSSTSACAASDRGLRGQGRTQSGHVSDTDPSCGSCANPGTKTPDEQSPVRRPQQRLRRRTTLCSRKLDRSHGGVNLNHRSAELFLMGNNLLRSAFSTNHRCPNAGWCGRRQATR